MDLFVINRHINDNETVKPEVDEEGKLAKVLKRIELNKKRRSRKRESLKEKSIGAKSLAIRQKKREANAKIIHVPENRGDFIDENIQEDTEELKDEAIDEKFTADPSTLDKFTVLGNDKFDKKPKVKRVLPKWLSNPTVISVDLQNLKTKVSDLKEIDKMLRKKLKENNVRYLFPVQAKVIPWLLSASKHADIIFPRDVCVSSPTGSGKTLAFVLPVIQALKRHTVRKIRALVILPTQDLAVQVFKSFKTYSQDTSIAVCLITGHTLFVNEQKQLIHENVAFGYLSKADILVCTAGRLVEHIKSTKGFDLQNLEFLVIDEADRVLDSVQNDWLYHLEKHINGEYNLQNTKVVNLWTLKKRRPPQKLLFSATLSQDPEKLQMLSLFQPKLFTSVVESIDHGSMDQESASYSEKFIGKYTTPKELTEKYIVTSLELKPLVLYRFIKIEKLTRTLIFTHSQKSAHRLSILLKALFRDEMKVEETSSNLEAKHRKSLIEEFTNGIIDLLVCTDSLARGIDLSVVQCVVSYSVPRHLKTYIHRAGRTARAGEPGLAVTILHKSQLHRFQKQLKQADKNNLSEIKISDGELEPLEELYREALDSLKTTIKDEESEDLVNKIRIKKLSMRNIGKRKA